jgi:hypothetical protein
LIAVAAAASLVLLAAVGAEAYELAVGCGSVDPTDPANYTAARIVNDTASAITLDDCRGGYCTPDQPSATIGPGQSVAVDGACGVSGGDMTSWRISRDGIVVGYIAIHSPKSRNEDVYNVSRLSADRRTPTPPAVTGSTTG